MPAVSIEAGAEEAGVLGMIEVMVSGRKIRTRFLVDTFRRILQK
jgi:hypothetical protein